MSGVNDKSILTSVKGALGIEEDNTDFDPELIDYINGAFSTLNQLAVGPDVAFFIADDQNQWSDFIGDTDNINSVITYVNMQTRLDFDPPQTSFAMEAMKNRVLELGWRLNVEAEKQKAEA